MGKNEFSAFRELTENTVRLMHCMIKNAKTSKSDELSLNTSQVRVILLLKKFKSLKMSELTNRANVVKSSMTNIVDFLETLDLVERLRDKRDRRIVYVTLTSEGEEVANSLRECICHSFEAKTNCLSEEEKEEFIEIVYKLNSFIKQMECHNEK